MTGQELQDFLYRDFALSPDKVDYFPNSNERTIPDGADLNSPEYYLKGSFTVSLSATASSLSNCPTTEAFSLFNFYLLGTNNLLPGYWCYCTRILIDYHGQIFTQAVNTTVNPNEYCYSDWKKYSYTVMQ